jgi:hypothetical protein
MGIPGRETAVKCNEMYIMDRYEYTRKYETARLLGVLELWRNREALVGAHGRPARRQRTGQ